jgi:hypothetical protein
VCEEELELLRGQWVQLHAAIERGDAGVVQAALRARDVSGLSRAEELCESLEVRGSRHEVLLQQLIAGLEPIERLVEALEGPESVQDGRLVHLADVFRKSPLSERSVLQHLGDLESFCTRVALQHQEKDKGVQVESLGVVARRGTVDEDDAAEDDPSGGAEAKQTATVKNDAKAAAAAATAAAAAKKAAPVLPLLYVPEIRDDYDDYFGEEADQPIATAVMRYHVRNVQTRRRLTTVALLQVMNLHLNRMPTPPPLPVSCD